jgi:hypothetical protein
VIRKESDIEKRYMGIEKSAKYVRSCKSERIKWRVLKNDREVCEIGECER